MTWVAVAVAGSAVVGAVASNSAANKQASSAKKGLNQSSQLANQSRMTAIDLYNRGEQGKQAGQLGAFNFYKQASPLRIDPFVQGNIGAQKILGQGATQANNAILGLPVDMSFANNPQQIRYDQNYLQSSQMPTQQPSFSNEQGIQPEQKIPVSDSGGMGMGIMQDPKNIKQNLDVKNRVLNPLGVSEKINNKISPSKHIKKLLHW